MAEKTALLILDRVVEDYVPAYSVYGMTTCDRCEHLVYVGHETARTLLDNEIRPICLECARELAAEHPDQFVGGPKDHVVDGVCPNLRGSARAMTDVTASEVRDALEVLRIAGYQVVDPAGHISVAGAVVALRLALDDLWVNISSADMRELQPSTVRLATANHDRLHHT